VKICFQPPPPTPKRLFVCTASVTSAALELKSNLILFRRERSEERNAFQVAVAKMSLYLKTSPRTFIVKSAGDRSAGVYVHINTDLTHNACLPLSCVVVIHTFLPGFPGKAIFHKLSITFPCSE